MGTDTLRTDPAAAEPTGEPDDGPGLVTDHRRQRRILIAMCTALVAVVASVSGLNVAQQDLAVDLGATQSALLWIINGYTLALAALLLPIGAIGDRFGRRPVLFTGLALFVAANTLAGFSTTVTMLLVARIAAGVAAAMIMPVTLSVITSSFPPEERARAVGVWAGFAGAGGILGLFASSAIVDYFTWPWLFAVPAGLALVALAVATTTVGNTRERPEGRFDTGGSVLSALGIGGLVLGIHEGPEQGWTVAITLVSLAVGLVALVAFAVWELRQAAPLLDVRVFADRSLAGGSITLLIVFAVMFGLFLVLVQFLQAVLGWSALRAATGLLPMAAVLMPLATASATIAQRFGTRRILLAGVTLFGIGLALLASLTSVSGGYWSAFPGLIVLGAGMGLAMTPSTMAITDGLPADRQGVASALNDTVRELGGAVGIALIGSVLNSGYRAGVADTAARLPAELARPVEEGIGTALATAPRLGPDAPSVIEAAREAFLDGWRTSMWVGVGMAAVALAYLALFGPARRISDRSEAPAVPSSVEPSGRPEPVVTTG